MCIKLKNINVISYKVVCRPITVTGYGAHAGDVS